jgi:diguanylate cyclase (GGDEF)-like protein
MAADDPMFANERAGGIQGDLRRLIVSLLIDRSEMVTADAIAIFPYCGAELLDAAYCGRLGQQLIRLLAFTVRDARADTRGGSMAELHKLARERSLPVDQLFTLAYLTERTALDELALDASIGAASERWPLVAQLVRRASFDLLAAYVEHAQLEPGGAGVTDKLTTLFTRPVLDAVIGKEVERAGRFGYPISLILFDVDHLSAINQAHGYGVGDKILERLGVLMRTYFRQHDWVARHSEDSFAVLLTRTEAANASELAERVRSTVADRFGFIDHRDDRPVTVTVSAAVINLDVALGDMIDPERLMAEAEGAVERAKRQGRNRVERVDNYSGAASHPPASSS